QAGGLQIRLGGLGLSLAGGQVGLRLGDLVGELPLLQAQRRLGLPDLGGEPLDVVGVVGGGRLQLLRHDRGQQLVLLDRVSLGDQQAAELPPDLGADDDVVGGHHTGQRQAGGAAVGVGEGAAASGSGEDQHHDEARVFHHALKHLYKTFV